MLRRHWPWSITCHFIKTVLKQPYVTRQGKTMLACIVWELRIWPWVKRTKISSIPWPAESRLRSQGNAALTHFQGRIRSLIRPGTLSILSEYWATVPDFVITAKSDKFASPCGLLNHSAEQTKHCLHLNKLAGKSVEIYFGIWTSWLK